MTTDKTKTTCPDCETTDLDRRRFVQGGAALVAGGVLAAGTLADAAEEKKKKKKKKERAAETAVTRFYATLTDAQKKEICLPFNHEKRKRISANWHVTKPKIDDDFYTNDQRAAIRDIVKGVTSGDGYARLQKQMEDDAGGFGAYSVAIFGEPGSGKFQWALTGRHLTLRADGDSVKNAAFGGPIIYGHGEEDIKENLFYYQTKKANEVFEALDSKQRKEALIAKAPRENAVLIQGKEGKFPGVSVGDLSSDQRDLVEQVVKVMLRPYRTEDVNESLKLLKKGGGFDKLHMAFYQQDDIGKDEVWDIWRVEGPSFVWHFRGAPHVHTYVNIGLKS